MNLTKKSLRGYQFQEIEQLRLKFREGFNAIMIQLVTGGGKTRMVAEVICNAIQKKNPDNEKQRIWFVVPRKELLWQRQENNK